MPTSDDNIINNDWHSQQEAAITALQAASDHDLRVPYYCEENVWRLAYRKTHQQPEYCYFVIFIGNSIKNVPMFFQRASSDPHQASCCWDYHVILLATRGQPYNNNNNNSVLVYDLDSVLDYPVALEEYLTRSFPYQWPRLYAPRFRVVPARLFLRHFGSDRSHMFHAPTQQWNAPPPSYACINMTLGMTSSSRRSNFRQYIDFVERAPRKPKSTTTTTTTNMDVEETEEDAQIYGEILSLQQLPNYPLLFAEEEPIAS